MTGLYNNAGLPLYSPTTHLLRFCSIPAAYKRRITQKERKDDGFERFITPSVPFAERRIIIMTLQKVSLTTKHTIQKGRSKNFTREFQM